jgi:hypothetical protein
MGWGKFVKKVKNVVKDPVSYINPLAAAQTFAATGGQSPSEAIVSAGESIQGGIDTLTGKAAMEDAQAAQDEASRKAMDVQERMYMQGREDLAPWREAGKAALGTLQEKVAAGPGEYTQSPGYQARLDEGNRNILAQRGNYRSGATDKALTKYGQDYATNDYDNFLNRYYQSLTPLQSLSGTGLTTTGKTADMGTQFGQSSANQILRAGEQKASGYTDRYNAMTGLVGQGAGLAAMTYGGPGWTWGAK